MDFRNNFIYFCSSHPSEGYFFTFILGFTLVLAKIVRIVSVLILPRDFSFCTIFIPQLFERFCQITKTAELATSKRGING